MNCQTSSKKILMASYCNWNSPNIKIGEHHFTNYFSDEGWKIFWISNPISPFHIFRKERYVHFKTWVKGVQKEESVIYYTPFTLLPCHYIFPFYFEWVGKNSLRFCLPSIKNILKDHGYLDVELLWIRDLSQFYLINIVNYKKLILRLVDDYPAYEKSPKYIGDIQSKLIKKADIVLITSKELYKYRVDDKNNFYYVPNGVDVEHFSKKRDLPKEYELIKRPRIIYVGAIANWFDCKLMDDVMKKLPNYNFIFIGPISININKLKENLNCFFLGPRSYDSIPAYMQHADVGIIPFKVDSLTQSVSPIKMFEYFAAGIPVVATSMKEAESMKPPAYFSKSIDEFSNNIVLANMKNRKEDYKLFAYNNSWRARFNIIKDIIDGI